MRLFRRPPQSPLPSNKPLPQGSVLCLDIDGVCAPFGSNLRFIRARRTRDFVALPTHAAEHFHPALPQRLAELARAFTHVAWVSSWQRNCAAFAAGAGIKFAAQWPYLPSSDPSDETDLRGRGNRRFGRTLRLQRPPPHPQPAQRMPLMTSRERPVNQPYFATTLFRAIIRPIRPVAHPRRTAPWSPCIPYWKARTSAGSIPAIAPPGKRPESPSGKHRSTGAHSTSTPTSDSDSQRRGNSGIGFGDQQRR